MVLSISFFKKNVNFGHVSFPRNQNVTFLRTKRENEENVEREGERKPRERSWRNLQKKKKKKKINVENEED